jgi:hypothetical protein
VRAMSQVVIENPILNSPFDEPDRHFVLLTTAHKRNHCQRPNSKSGDSFRDVVKK